MTVLFTFSAAPMLAAPASPMPLELRLLGCGKFGARECEWECVGWECVTECVSQLVIAMWGERERWRRVIVI